jgi:hypothetical protein
MAYYSSILGYQTSTEVDRAQQGTHDWIGQFAIYCILKCVISSLHTLDRIMVLNLLRIFSLRLSLRQTRPRASGDGANPRLHKDACVRPA